MNFGNNLKNFRKSKKMSQEDLADKVGVSRQSVSKWETGDAYPEMTNIVCLCKIFHCQITDLINDDLVDNEKFDDKTKNEIILFKKNQQDRMKHISKIIYVLSRIAYCTLSIPIVFLLFLAILFPCCSSSLDLDNNKIEVFNQELSFSVDKNIINIEDAVIEVPTSVDLNNFINTHSKRQLIICLEFKIITTMILAILLLFVFYYVYKLYRNINVDNTPFNLINEKIINKAIIIYLLYILFDKLSSSIFVYLTNGSFLFNLGVPDFIVIFIIISVIYLFKYGRMIQADSKSKIYDK